MALRGLFARFAGNTASQTLGYASGTAIGNAITPVLQDVLNKAWAEHPALPLALPWAAAIALKNPDRYGEMAAEAKMQGLDRHRFDDLVDAVDSPPSSGELLELLRRRAIDEARFRAGLADLQIPRRWHDDLLVLRRQHLSPADATMARVQGHIDQGEQHRRMALFGLDAVDAELLYEVAGEPPGPETMLELWRRGVVDQGRVEQAIAESRIKLKYIPDLLHLREQHLAPAVAAEAVLKAQISHAEGQRIAALSGVGPADFAILSKVNGRPIATGEALDLIRRGERDRAWFTEVVARSDVRPEYADDILLLRRRLPSLLQIRQLVQHGSIADELATRYVTMQGYDAELAQGIVEAAHGAKTQAERDLTKSEITALYQDKALDRPTAATMIGGLGYDQHEVDLILALADARSDKAYRTAAIGVAKRRYLDRELDLAGTSALLDRIGLQPDERDRYLDLWEFELAASPRRLTEAQARAAMKAGVRPVEWYAGYLDRLGYPADEKDVLLELYAR